MGGLRILITNNSLRSRAGTELYVSELATALIARGHVPAAYSPALGPVAEDLRAAGVTVVDDLGALPATPDLIHGQHHFETMTALLRFPGVPAVHFCHGALHVLESPLSFPRILAHVAVDDACRDRLLEHGIPRERVRVIRNWVDLERFRPRAALPPRPRRALIFSNYAHERTHVAPVREACRRAGLSVDVVGAGSGNAAAAPETLLGQYDLVFAKGRCALEAAAVGTAVIACDARGLGPMVTVDELDRVRALNFGTRLLSRPLEPALIGQEIARYDAGDAAEVSHRIRATSGRDAAVDEIVRLYREVLAEHAATPPAAALEGPAAGAYLGWLKAQLEVREAAVDDLTDEVRMLHASLAVRLANRLGRLPALGSLAKVLARRIS